jgi:hypothetical protein
MRPEIDILHLKPAARSKRIVSFFENCGGILEGREQGAAMDVVEFLVEDPLILGIVNLKLTVWRDTVNLEML